MSRLPTPASIAASPAASQPLLLAVEQSLGSVPNMFRLVGNSPAALEGCLGMMGALAKGALPAATRERIALAVSEANGCDDCLAAHAYLGKRLAKLSDDEIAANRAAQVIEIVQHVALNTWTNDLNEVAGTEIDFPAIAALETA